MNFLGSKMPPKKRKRKQKQADDAAAQADEAKFAELQKLANRVAALAADARAHPTSESSALFEWCDGPLVRAMRRGEMMLLDEISLADDAVLERLNSVLEVGRTLTLVERGDTGGDVEVCHSAR